MGGDPPRDPRPEADLVVLSEAPPDDWLDELVADDGPGGVAGPGRERRRGMATGTSWSSARRAPLRLVRREPIADGAGMVVEADGPAAGSSGCWWLTPGATRCLSRTPRLLDVAAACRRAREAGEPIDVVVGDFNSVAPEPRLRRDRGRGVRPGLAGVPGLARDVPLGPPGLRHRPRLGPPRPARAPVRAVHQPRLGPPGAGRPVRGPRVIRGRLPGLEDQHVGHGRAGLRCRGSW